MKASIFAKRKKRGRPATGVTPMVGVRISADARKQIEAWAETQADNPSLSEAIRRLFELGLKAAPHQPERSPEPVVTAAPAEPASLWPMPTEVEQALGGSPEAVAKATDMAGQQIDKLGDASATNEERQSRKRRL